MTGGTFQRNEEVPPRPTIEEYREWLADRCRDQYDRDNDIVEPQAILQRQREIFENVAQSLRVQFEESAFWATQLLLDLKNRHSAATISGHGLLAHPDQTPTVLKKPWDSLVLKSYRRNVLDNPRWPDPPEEGWTLPDNWLECVTDVVRTTVVVRYLDGIDVVRQAIESAAASIGVECEFNYENRDEGYYALHVTAWLPFRFSSGGYGVQAKILPVEIQVCTQIQEVLRVLTHKSYEATRRKPRSENDRWQWRWQCDQFTPNYLGHILHYADGVMVGLLGRPDRR